MADKEVADLTSAGTLDGTESFHLVKGGNSRKSLVSAVLTYIQGAITYTDITAAWNGPSYAAAYVRRSAPAAAAGYSFMQADFDSSGNLIRTYDYATGRMDMFGNTGNKGAACVVAYGGTGADGNELGHLAYRGKDSGGNFNTFCYVLGTATNVSNAAASLNSKLYFGVMNAQSAGAGNAQPNWGVTLDGSSKTLAFDSTGIITSKSGGLQLASGATTILTLTTTQTTVSAPFQINRVFTASKSTNYGVANSDAGTILSNAGAAGEVDFTLPASPTSSGQVHKFEVLTAQVVKIIANTGQKINNAGSLSTTAGNATCSTVGAYIELTYSAFLTQWIVTAITGTWTLA